VKWEENKIQTTLLSSPRPKCLALNLC